MKFKVLFAVVTLMFALPASALDLHGARSSGLIGEKADGYAAALKQTPDVVALVEEVNTKRRQEYSRISKQNGQPADVVAKLAAVEIIKGLPAGSKYQGSGGGWTTR